MAPPLSALRCWTETNPSALSHNLRLLRKRSDGREVIGVIKANAYGHGMKLVAPILAQSKIRTFAVASLPEATRLSLLLPKADILILSPLLPSEIPLFVKNPRWIATLSHGVEFLAFEHEAARQKKKIRAHLKIDTGMGRTGALPSEALELLPLIQNSAWVKIDGLYSHFSSAATDKKFSSHQLQSLQKLIKNLRQENSPIPFIHFHNSAGVADISIPPFVRAVRPGISLYGVLESPSAWKKSSSQSLQPVLSWKTRVCLLRDLPTGCPISYNQTFRTRRKTRLALLSAGYADGISRKLSNRGQVLIRGQRCPILGRITMDITLVDVTDAKGIQWGDEAILIGTQGREQITVQEWARWAETNPYEVFCCISNRVPRLKSPGRNPTR